jgi:hypothetical protein
MRWALSGVALTAVLLTAVWTLSPHRAALAAPATDERTDAAVHWLGRPVSFSSPWRAVAGPDGARFQATMGDGGLMEVSAASLRVDEFVDGREVKARSGPGVTQAVAEAVARQFASAHFGWLDRLTERSVTSQDHGAFRDYRIVWQLRQNSVWLPTKVTVGINASDGNVAYYWSQEHSTALSTSWSVSAQSAEQAALGAVTLPVAPAVTAQDLEVVLDSHNAEHLVWVVTLEAQFGPGLHMPSGATVWVDATTGVAQVVART